MAIDTACSSALVAVHEACQSLWSGESRLALTGGVNMLIKPTPFVGFCKASMLSPAGRCKSFDATGDGYVRAEGGAVLVLKPLQEAERDRDRILGLIVATGVNSDGRTRGLSLPSEAAQEALLRQVYDRASIAPEEVFYVEAHGTGTSVGDPIECNAIGAYLARDALMAGPVTLDRSSQTSGTSSGLRMRGNSQGAARA
jgi:phthiocerol/phenolphthiocerol synthesis type-I polyketide synthase C